MSNNYEDARALNDSPQVSPKLFRNCTVDFVEILQSYLNCKNCGKEIDNEEEHFGKCSKCKRKFSSLVENFSFILYLGKDAKYDHLKGCRKNLAEFETSNLQDLDINDLGDIENRLESLFVEKKITVEYTLVPPSERDKIMRSKGQKFIHKIHHISKNPNDLMVEDDEPPRKKTKIEDEDI